MLSHIATARPRPVLMTPVRRCGSHALRLRLCFNPDFYAPYPLHLVDFMPLVEQYGDLSDDDVYFQLIVDIVGLQTASMVKWDGVVFDPVELFDKLKDQPRSVHRVVRAFTLGDKKEYRDHDLILHKKPTAFEAVGKNRRLPIDYAYFWGHEKCGAGVTLVAGNLLSK